MGLTHSYTLQENVIRAADLTGESGVVGPILALTDRSNSFLVAYEHGSTVPENFLRFTASREGQIILSAVKGNTLEGQRMDASHPWISPWFETGAVGGGCKTLRQRICVLFFLA